MDRTQYALDRSTGKKHAYITIKRLETWRYFVRVRGTAEQTTKMESFFKWKYRQGDNILNSFVELCKIINQMEWKSDRIVCINVSECMCAKSKSTF